MLGVLLVLVAVVVGARVVAGSDKSTDVWAVRHDVAAGTTLTGADLARVRVRLYDDAGAYLSTVSSPAGKVATRDLRSGELLPRSALALRPAGVLLPLAVATGNYPTALAAGDRIDVYASAGATGGSADPSVLVLSGVAVQAVSASGSGFASASDKVQILVRVDPDEAPGDVPRIANRDLYVVQVVGDRPPASPSGGH